MIFTKLIPALLISLSLLAQAPAPAPSSKAKAAKVAKKAEPAGDLLDINTATVEQLKALDGIGDVYSGKIVAGRPYANKSQLISKKIVPQATYAKIKDKIIATQANAKQKK